MLLFLTGFVFAGCSNVTPSQASDSQTSESTDVLLTDEEYFDELVPLMPVVNADNYNSDDYGFYDYKDLMREPGKYTSAKVKIINAKIIQVIDAGKYTEYLITTPNDDIYMAIIESDRLETKLLEDDVVYFNGRPLLTYKYPTTGGTLKEVPLIYIDAYMLTEQ